MGTPNAPAPKPAGKNRPSDISPRHAEAMSDRLRAQQNQPLTWKAVAKHLVPVVVAGVAIYLVLPSIIAVLSSWPRLIKLNPIWFVVALASEAAHFMCTFMLQRLALRTKAWFAVVTSDLAGNAITNVMPGGDAAGAAVQFRML